MAPAGPAALVALAMVLACGKEPIVVAEQRGTGDGGSDAGVPIECGGPLRAFSSGDDHTCVVLANGDVRCFGQDTFGQLGDGETSDSLWPVETRMPVPAIAIAAGDDHTCAIDESGAIWCWGLNSDGQLGIGDTVMMEVEPVRLDTTFRAVAISTLKDSNCAIADDGALHCWGRNEEGELGLGDREDRPSPTRVGTASDWTQIAVGWFHVCGLRGSRLFCWGSNGSGRLGDGTTTTSDEPIAIAGEWLAVDAGVSHTCAIRSDRSLHCWGRNADGQLGTGDLEERLVPTQVGTGADWIDVAASGPHSCALRADLSVHCWGTGIGLGLAGVDQTLVPMPVIADAIDVEASDDLTCALRSSRVLFCFGDNDDGELGIGNDDQHPGPVEVCGDP